MFFVFLFLVIVTAIVSLSRPRVDYGRRVGSAGFTINTGDIIGHYHRDNRTGLMAHLQAIVVHPQITHVAVVWKNPETNELCVVDFAAAGHSRCSNFAIGFDSKIGDASICNLQNHLDRYEGCVYIVPQLNREEHIVTKCDLVALCQRFRYMMNVYNDSMSPLTSFLHWRSSCDRRSRRVVCTEFVAHFHNLLIKKVVLHGCLDITNLLQIRDKQGSYVFQQRAYPI